MRFLVLAAFTGSVLLAACGDDVATDAGLTVPDLGRADSGSRDLGAPDLGRHPDASANDTGVIDTGVDAGTDAGEEVDAGSPDSGPVDTGPSCSDGIRNEDELWVDCGGWCNNLCPACPNTGNLLRNPSFESASNPGIGQGIMPDEWVVVIDSPDTYSNDASFGLAPTDFGNFPGVLAQDGLRWVAGWSAVPESMGQVLSSTLTPGARYRLEGYLHPALRADLAAPGTYTVHLADDTGRDATTELGHFASTSTVVAWQPRRLEFVAPNGAEQLPLFYFVPTSSIGSTYPGLDNLVLIQTSSCAE